VGEREKGKRGKSRRERKIGEREKKVGERVKWEREKSRREYEELRDKEAQKMNIKIHKLCKRKRDNRGERTDKEREKERILSFEFANKYFNKGCTV